MLLQQVIDSKHFTELMAFKRRNTLSPNTWFPAAQLARVVAHDPPERFVPISLDEDAIRERHAAAAESHMDRDAVEG